MRLCLHCNHNLKQETWGRGFHFLRKIGLRRRERTIEVRDGFPYIAARRFDVFLYSRLYRLRPGSPLRKGAQLGRLYAALQVCEELSVACRVRAAPWAVIFHYSYWQIGRDILDRQQKESWGAKVIDRLAADLKREFPDMKGFSPRNLKYMRRFAEVWAEEEFVQQVAAQLPWFHNCVLLDKVADRDERRWYARAAIHHGWSRAILVHQIESDLKDQFAVDRN